MFVDFDAAYLVVPKVKSRITGYFYLSEKYTTGTKSPIPSLNGPIHIECQILKHMVPSAAEAETSGIFLSIKVAIWIRRMLEDLGHSQNIVHLKTDNSTAEIFSNSSLKKKTRCGTCVYVG